MRIKNIISNGDVLAIIASIIFESCLAMYEIVPVTSPPNLSGKSVKCIYESPGSGFFLG